MSQNQELIKIGEVDVVTDTDEVGVQTDFELKARLLYQQYLIDKNDEEIKRHIKASSKFFPHFPYYIMFKKKRDVNTRKRKLDDSPLSSQDLLQLDSFHKITGCKLKP